MAARTDPTPHVPASPTPHGLPITHDLHDAITTRSTSQRAIIGPAADFADSGEWAATTAVSAAHWIAGAADIEVATAREWIRVGRRLRSLPVLAALCGRGNRSGCDPAADASVPAPAAATQKAMTLWR